jgi:hypothetical protein
MSHPQGESSTRRATEKIRWREKGKNLEESKEENEERLEIKRRSH